MLKLRREKKNMLEVTSIQPKSVQAEDMTPQIEQSGSELAHRIELSPCKGLAGLLNPRISENHLQVQEQSRKPLSWLLMVANMFAVLLSCFQNGVIIYAPQQKMELVGIGFACIMVLVLATCLYTSCYLATDKWELFNLYVLIDNMLLVSIAASIGFVSFNQFRSDGQWYFYLVAVSFPFDFLLLVGNFRVLMVKGEWTKWRIILYKFTLLVCCIMFFQIGVYFITVDYSYTDGKNSTFDGTVKQLMLLNVFGTFSLIIEMYSKMTDLDHTGELQSTYELKQFNDNELANNLLEYTQLLKYKQEAQRKGLLKHN